MIARRLNLRKEEVHNYFYKEMKDAGLLERLLGEEPDQTAVHAVVQLPGYTRMEHARNAVYVQQPVRRTSRYSSSDKPESAGDKIKLAIWFINKMGGAEQAKQALDIAIMAVNTLEKPNAS